jgi:hypothetical protein
MPYRRLVQQLNGETVHKVYVYEPETGKLWRKTVASGMKRAGTPSHDDARGHVTLITQFAGRSRPVSHIIWLYMTGEWPTLDVEHKDLNPLNNRWDNLRLATRSQNMANIKVTRRSKSGVKGVFWDKARYKWGAYITHNYKVRNLGRYDKIEDAKAAYDKAARELFGEFARS